MTIEKIHEHSVDTSLLPEGAKILDIGARGFLFAEYFERLGHDVTCIDADDLPYTHNRHHYLECAISDYNGDAEIIRNKDLQATSIKRAEEPYDKLKDYIHCYTLVELSNICGIPFWSLIKIDIEGSEYQVIMSLEKAPATQLSIEFHLHTGIYGMYEMTLMEDKLKALGYYPAKHEMTEEHGAGTNFWDSLWILK